MSVFSGSKTWAFTLLMAVFLAGGAAGWAVGHRGDPPRMGPDPRGIADFLARRLDLTAIQRDSVRAVFQRHHEEMRAIFNLVRPRMDSLRARVRTEVEAQLSPEQRTKYARLLDDLEHQHQEHMRRDSAMGPEGRH